MGRRSDDAGDVFGIVDPVGWRIQFFTLDDWMVTGAKPLAQRVHWAGACRLSPDRRIWRVHALPGRVVLQLQPNPTVDEIQRGSALGFQKLELATDPSAIASIEKLGPSLELDKEVVAPWPRCGGAADDAVLPSFTSQDASSTITGGNARAFVVTPRAPGSSAFLSSSQTIGASAINQLTPGGVLTSVQELEDARSASSGTELRHFLLVARSGSVPGFARSAVVIVRRSAGGKLDGSMRIDTGLARVKTGQRFAAVSSKGEVLLIGAAEKDAFWIKACHFTDTPDATSPCSLVRSSAPTKPGAQADAPEQPPAIAPAATPNDASLPALWTRASWFDTQQYRFDASTLPDDCRLAVAACRVGAYGGWNVISPMRFARGIYARRGVPYAQRPSDSGTPSRSRPTADLPHETTADGIPVLPVFARNGGVDYIVSDINNDGLPTGDPNDLKLLGIDCSTFLAKVWGVPVRSTKSLIGDVTAGRVRRVDAFGHLRSGDAMLINLSNGGHTLINHVVIFRESRPAGPTDSSMAVLVAESSSACGGVCTTLYDESFFDGWALISRGKVPSGYSTPFSRVPNGYGEWLTLRSAGRIPQPAAD